MLALPPVPPAAGWEHTLRLPRDHYVRLDSRVPDRRARSRLLIIMASKPSTAGRRLAGQGRSDDDGAQTRVARPGRWEGSSHPRQTTLPAHGPGVRPTGRRGWPGPAEPGVIGMAVAQEPSESADHRGRAGRAVTCRDIADEATKPVWWIGQ
jgi:hypothetical protein